MAERRRLREPALSTPKKKGEEKKSRKSTNGLLEAKIQQHDQ